MAVITMASSICTRDRVWRSYSTEVTAINSIGPLPSSYHMYLYVDICIMGVDGIKDE